MIYISILLVFFIAPINSIKIIRNTENTMSPQMIRNSKEIIEMNTHYSRSSSYCTECRNARYNNKTNLDFELKRNVKRRNRNNKKNLKHHQVFIIPDKNITLRNLHSSSSWTEWSEWSKCDNNCQTYRNKFCVNFRECQTDVKAEYGYCYLENGDCKNIVQKILGNINIYNNNKKYEKEQFSSNYFRSKRKQKRIPTGGRCGRIQNMPKMLKILGGEESKRNKWPWHVALINQYKQVHCAGTLISPRWVLTAAHCVRHSMSVRLNEYDLTVTEAGEREIRVINSIIHPKFNPVTVDNDIALLQLSDTSSNRRYHYSAAKKRLPRHTSAVTVACLPTTRPKAKKKCHIMGWGKKNNLDQYGVSTLREATISIIRPQVCRRAYRHYLLTKNMFCAGVPSGKIDTCGGDSGGGLMCPKNSVTGSSTKVSADRTFYTVDGITSFGDGCGNKGKYGIYTLVHNYITWIKLTIRYNS